MSLNLFFGVWENIKAFCLVGVIIRSNLPLFRRHKSIMGISHFSAGYNHYIGFAMLLFCSIFKFLLVIQNITQDFFYYLETIGSVCPCIPEKIKTTLLPSFLSYYKFLKNMDFSSGYLLLMEAKEFLK